MASTHQRSDWKPVSDGSDNRPLASGGRPERGLMLAGCAAAWTAAVVAIVVAGDPSSHGVVRALVTALTGLAVVGGAAYASARTTLHRESLLLAGSGIVWTTSALRYA